MNFLVQEGPNSEENRTFEGCCTLSGHISYAIKRYVSTILVLHGIYLWYNLLFAAPLESECENGVLTDGICECDEDFTGEYCECKLSLYCTTRMIIHKMDNWEEDLQGDPMLWKNL